MWYVNGKTNPGIKANSRGYILTMWYVNGIIVASDKKVKTATY